MKVFPAYCAAVFFGATTMLSPWTSHAQDLPRMREVVEMAETKEQFAGSILITQDDRVLIDKGYGLANREWNQANSPATKFRRGFISKQFTAAAVLLLEERGKLKLDDLVKLYVPDAPSVWDDITIAHLLNHTEGLHNFTD